ncbi:MAG: RidA family protein, partial [Ruminococcaceae bacterium]|nr:RidA family protein [Oscillospiraceae bacterium]
QMGTAEDRLSEQGLSFPKQRLKGQGVTPYKIIDDLLFIGGVAPYGADGTLAFKGRLGSDLTIEQGHQAARLVGLNMLQIIRVALGDLDRVDYVVKVVSMVSTTKGFSSINQVSDGFSDLLTEILGERGLHARNAIGASTLHENAPVICDAIVKIRR